MLHIHFKPGAFIRKTERCPFLVQWCVGWLVDAAIFCPLLLLLSFFPSFSLGGPLAEDGGVQGFALSRHTLRHPDIQWSICIGSTYYHLPTTQQPPADLHEGEKTFPPLQHTQIIRACLNLRY